MILLDCYLHNSRQKYLILTCLWICESDHWDVHVYYFELVGPGDLQGRLQHVQQLAHVLVRDVHGALGVKLDPDLVEHVVVLVCDPIVDVVLGLGVVLQNHGDEHVHNDKRPGQFISSFGGFLTII